MLTSRAEHRLILRADNADDRLADRAFGAGLIDAARFRRVEAQRRRVTETIDRLGSVHLSPNNNTNELLAQLGLPPAARSQTAEEYLRRPEARLAALYPALAEIHASSFADLTLTQDEMNAVDIQVKYRAYIDKELQQIARVRDMESARLPASLDFNELPGLRTEAVEKLNEVRPTTLGQAGRIPGVTSGDIAVLAVRLRADRKRPAAAVGSES
jgi:tRNA uridine 5-carboxymethylaminomethyl modification enzyme